jgi:acetoin utilization deacetylase AcuC-like enzyme
MRVYHTDGFTLPLPPGHGFPTAKYRLLRERLLGEDVVTPAELLIPGAATDEALGRVHATVRIRFQTVRIAREVYGV